MLPRLRATAIHISISVAVALLAAGLVFGVWFPGDYRQLSGGVGLFVLITGVDVVLGPLLTLVVFDIRKPRAELRRDLAVVGLLQGAALVYGLHAMSLARPVALVHEVDRFRIVAPVQVLERELGPGTPPLSLTGPRLLSTRPVRPENNIEASELALQGYDIGQRPSYWRPYAEGQQQAVARSKPLSEWLAQHESARSDIEARVRGLGGDPATGRYVPLIARVPGWVVILGASGDVLGFAPFEGFENAGR
jgi:hypothetical protein